MQGYPLSQGGRYPFPEGRVPLVRGTSIPFPRDGGAPFPRNGSPRPEDGYPYCERGLTFSDGPLTLFLETCTPLPMNGYPLLRDAVSISEELLYPVSEGQEPHFRRTGTPSPRAGGH